MDSLDRLKRIDMLLEQIKDQSFVKSDKKFDRIGFHLTVLDQGYRLQLTLGKISIEELEFLRKILYRYQHLQKELCVTRDQLTVERNLQRRRTTMIQNGYFNKSMIKKSRYINNYK